MSQLPERYRAAIAPLIDKAREFLEKGEELAAMAFVGNFTTGAVVPCWRRPKTDHLTGR